MMGKLLVAATVTAMLAMPPAVSAEAAGPDPETGQELSDLERGLQELEDALEQLREKLTDEEAIARAEELARDLERKFSEHAETFAKEGADSVLRALEELIDAVPQYEWPEITDDGDIILRRVPPGERRKARPDDSDDFDET